VDPVGTSSHPQSSARHLAALVALMFVSFGLLAGCAEIHGDEGLHTPPGHAR
jgi:hypothetical protein